MDEFTGPPAAELNFAVRGTCDFAGWTFLVSGDLGRAGLPILRDPERQAWHDRVAGTYVVKVPRAYPV